MLTDQIVKLETILAVRKKISLEEAREIVGADVLFWAIASQQVYFDISKDLLVAQKTSCIYSDVAYYRALVTPGNKDERMFASDVINVVQGELFNWDDVPWEVLNVSRHKYTIRSQGNGIATLTVNEFAALVRKGNITQHGCAKGIRNLAAEQLLKASADDIKIATSRAAYIQGNYSADCSKETSPSPRTLRLWRKKYIESEAATGNGYLGLLPRISERGNRTSRLSCEQESQIQISLIEDYRTPAARSVRKAYELYKTRSRNAGVSCVSYNVYNSRAKSIDRWKNVEERHGEKAAYQVGPRIREHEITSENRPVHGDRPFDVAHIDHTQLEIELVSELTGQVLDRPWATFMLDAGSRMPLASVLTFESPSIRTLMMILRDCVARNGRLPSKIVVDQGSEFNSLYFEMVLAMYGIEKIERPPSEPRHGAPMERLFGTAQTEFIHTLIGNTKNSHLARSLSATHDPKKHAIWTPDSFVSRMNEWLFDVYPELPHLGILEKPRDRMERLIKESGLREHKYIPYDESFIIATMPAPAVATRVVQSNGIKYSHWYYSGPELQTLIGKRIKVDIRYDPYDPSYIYAFIDKRWAKLYTTSWMLQEYNERQIKQIHMEVSARARNMGRDYRAVPKILTNFLSELQDAERQLMATKAANKLAQIDLSCTPLDKQADTMSQDVRLSDLKPFPTVRI